MARAGYVVEFTLSMILYILYQIFFFGFLASDLIKENHET